VKTLLAFGLLATLASPARCGWDDFEFGKRLIDKGYLEYARKVFEGVMNDDKRPQGERDQARYGIALLGKAEVGTAQANPNVPYAEAKAKLDAAIASIGEFIAKYPNDAKADEARGEAGSLRLEFVTWASDLMENADTLTQRKVKADDILSDTQSMLAAATEVYAGLKTSAKTEGGKQIAEFQWVRCQFYKGLTFPKCSGEAKAAFTQAKTTLEDYASSNEQYLTGTFAIDFLGQTLRELGDCESEDAAKWKLYFSALDWFKACADTEDQGEDFRRIITTGYSTSAAGQPRRLHGNRQGQHAQGSRDYLAGMLQRCPAPRRWSTGLAMVEHALILHPREDRRPSRS
jgi:hypothetical protein